VKIAVVEDYGEIVAFVQGSPINVVEPGVAAR
jgi:hypothetical protein